MCHKGIVFGLIILLLLGVASAMAQDWRELLTTADSLSKANNQDSAIAIGNKTLQKVSDELGPNDTATASALISLGRYYYRGRDFKAAEPLWQKALTIQEAAFGPSHENVIKTKAYLGALYTETEQYETAESLYMSCLRSLESTGGQDAPVYVGILINFGWLYSSWSEYGKAESIYKRAIETERRQNGAETARMWWLLRDLGTVYFYELRNNEAVECYRQAQLIAAKLQGPQSLSVAGILANQANCCLYRLKDFNCAESLYNAARVICEDSNGVAGQLYGQLLNNLARLHDMQGEYGEADSLVRKALQVMENKFGPDDMNVRNVLNIQALICKHKGDYAAADSIYNRILNIDRTTAAAENEERALIYELISQLRCLQRNYAAAIGFAYRGFRIRDEKFDGIIWTLSEKDALGYVARFRTSVDNYVSCFLRMPSERPTPVEQAADIILSTKGRVTDCIYERQQISKEGTDPLVRSMIDSLTIIKSSLSRLLVQSAGSVAADFRTGADSLQRAADSLEAEVSSHSPSYRRRHEFWNITADRISTHLPEKAVLVEYLKYNHQLLQPDSTVPRYLMVVLTKTAKPVIVDLGTASGIDSLVNRYRLHMLRLAAGGSRVTNDEQEEYQQISAGLYERVWNPVEPYTDGKNLLFVAPDGALNLIAFAGLKDPGGKYLVERCAIQYLSSGRDLIRLRDSEKTNAGLLAMGDPDFDAPSDARSMETSKGNPASGEGHHVTRNLRSYCGELAAVLLSPIPDTRREVETIAGRWRESYREPAIIYFGPMASEEHFKAEGPGKRIIHLATHGYYLEDQCQPDVQGAALSSSSGFVGENPLLLSGLFLAGANLHGVGADSAGAEDGVLTAYEVSAMDLEGTDMVVLSACETGLGEVKTGEGVYGLRRAFQMAGAKTVVSALWQVPDWAMSTMMSQLYDRSAGSLPETIRGMQMNAIANLRKQGKPDHPYTWGAFIAMGEWR